MRASRFRIVHVTTRHDLAGIIVDDLIGQNEMWLMDEGFEATANDGFLLATRLIHLDPFYAAAGTAVPLDRAILQHALLTLAARQQGFGPKTLDSPRPPEAIYAAAIRGGAMNSIEFADTWRSRAVSPRCRRNLC